MSGVAVASHITCAIAFIIVTLILSGHRPTRTQFSILIISCFAITFWAALAAIYALGIIQRFDWVVTSEMVRNGLVFLCLLRLLKLTQRVNRERWYFRTPFYSFVGALYAFLLLSTFWADWHWHPGKSEIYARYYFVGCITFSVIILALIEQLYRGTVLERRWGIKLLCLGLGLMYCYEFYLYAHAALLNKMDPIFWEIRGAILATIAPLIGLSALKHRVWYAEILPSRAVIFKSSVLISCTIYLLLMGLLSFFVRQWGGERGNALQSLFFIGSLVLLASILSSVRIKAWTKLYISQNFFKLRYDYRAEWIRFSNLLSYEDYRELPSRVIKALADMVESPKGLLFEWEEKRGYVLKDAWNTPFPNKEIMVEPCSFTECLQQSGRSFEIPSRFSGNVLLAIPNTFKEISWAWLIVPLIHGNQLHAIVVLAHPRAPFFNVNWEVLDLLSMAGKQAAICLVQRQNMEALVIARQFEEYNRFSAFVMHDLKNVVSQLKLTQLNKEKHGLNPEFIKSVYHTIDFTTDKIDRLLCQMRTRQAPAKSEKMDVAKNLQKVIQLTNHRQPVPSLEWQVSEAEINILADEDRFVNVLCHLVENAQQATAIGGQVILIVALNLHRVKISVQDTGCGMDSEFIRTSLYKPFVTTKGEKGMGIGVYEAREYVHTLGGRLEVETIKDKGTIFTLDLPLLNNETALIA